MIANRNKLDYGNILNKNQHAYRSHYLIWTAIQHLLTITTNQQNTNVEFLDLSKAFNNGFRNTLI